MSYCCRRKNSKVSSENLEQLQINYQAGKIAFERGEYRQAVNEFEATSALVTPNSRLGGEVHIWLITAYEATGQRAEAIAVCKQLARHPDPETRKQAKNLLYIMQAPELSRRADWLTEIPDLTNLPDSDGKFRQGSAGSTSNRPKKRPEPEPIDLSQVNTKDNKFIWVALITIGLTLGGLVWFNL
jgi:tetratricopeptide (TPR) repeat protein